MVKILLTDVLKFLSIVDEAMEISMICIDMHYSLFPTIV